MKIDVNGQSFEIRKWKGRDKKNFLDAIKRKEFSPVTTLDVLVNSCLDITPSNLSIDEYKYLLGQIRIHSLGDDLSVALNCSACEHVFDYNYKISDVMKPAPSTLTEFTKNDFFVKFGRIKNQKNYVERVSINKELDILYQIEKVNDNDTFTMSELEEILDDLDLDILEDLIKHFNENRFRLENIVVVDCPECGFDNKFEFDELPGFFPDSWFKVPFEEILKEKGSSSL